MKNFLCVSIFASVFLVGCGGGGGNPGTCSGSGIYCSENMPGASSAATPGATNSSSSIDLFTKAGSGDTVFDIPARVTRVRIQGTFSGTTSNFIVKAAGSNIVNAIIGTSREPVAFDGIYLLAGGGAVEITSSAGVSWTFTEVITDSNLPSAGSFVKAGAGDTVFDMPNRITRIRIQGAYTGASSNFIVKVKGSYVVNEIIGTSRNPVALDRIYSLTGGGTVEITSSSGVLWTFTEVR